MIRLFLISLATLLFQGTATAAPRMQLSPEGQAIFKQFWEGKYASSRGKPTQLDLLKTLNDRIIALVQSEYPDLRKIYALIDERDELHASMQAEAKKAFKEFRHKLPKADQITWLRDEFRVSEPPIIVPHVGKKDAVER